MSTLDLTMQCRSSKHRDVGLLLLAAFTLGGCGDKWDAYVYPDKTRLSFSAHLGPFSSLEECRAAAHARLLEFSRQTSPDVLGDYECGKNCDGGRKLGDVAVCDETIR
jgi:hypothetical protein